MPKEKARVEMEENNAPCISFTTPFLYNKERRFLKYSFSKRR
jgi:hypothetical protein